MKPTGVVAGAVLRAARLSASLSEEQLASGTGVSEATIRSWEDGSEALASVPAPQIDQLKAALRMASADPRLVADLDAAAWCDLIILAMVDSEDASCLLADPLAREEAFGELLAWAIAGDVPARHRPYAGQGPLLPAADIVAIVGTAQAVLLHNPCPSDTSGTSF